MIDSKALLADLQKEVTRLHTDLRARCNAEPSVDAPLKAQYDAARAGQRTALTYNAWREEELTNVAVAWVLACVFIRFLEDNALVETLHLAGPDAAGIGRARDQQIVFFREHPGLSEREYLEHAFTETARLPGMADLFDRRHNPLWTVGPTGDAARAFLEFWRRTDAESGHPVHDFSDPGWNTRFLGDLYQDLSEAARKRYALLQTPVFIEQFILDRTLTPAIETFGFREVRMIDPTCGSGHFLLGGFARLFALWNEALPGEVPSVIAQHALDQVFGVDLNPNVVAIARFRLLLAALRACGTTKLRNAYAFSIHVTSGDALLHGAKFDRFGQAHYADRQSTFDTEAVFRDELKHHYEVEDIEALHRILGQQYHAVVGNPPYITVKDRAVSELYRARYSSCYRKYALSVPFMERFFDLAVKGDGTPQQPAGFVGQITANSFMKREFGKKLIEEYLPRWDLTHVIDTDKAHIPGHATGTVILFGKNQAPIAATLRVVMGIKKQEPTPVVPEAGLVWLAILGQVDVPGSQSEWVTVADATRVNFHRHPWSIGGGGAAELKEEIEDEAECTLLEIVTVVRKKPVIGPGCVVGDDEAFSCPVGSLPIRKLSAEFRRRAVEGDLMRNWHLGSNTEVVFPYSNEVELRSNREILDYLWPLRTVLAGRNDFGKMTYRDAGRPFWEYHQIPIDRNRAPLFLAYGEIATHNHFLLAQAGKVFTRTAPIILLKSGTTLEAHLQLLGVLNSSTACFWLRQVCHDKGGGGIGGGIASEPWEHRFAFNGTQVANVPIPTRQPSQLPTALVQTSTALQAQSPAATLASWSGPASGELRTRLATARDQATRLRRQLIAWQEELDWQIYEAFGLISEEDDLLWPEDRMDELPPLELGERTFEIFMARQMARGTLQTTWFERHAKAGSKAITSPPENWSEDYLALYHRRHVAIQQNHSLRLIEQPEYKRRWNTEPWDEQFTRAARDWLLARLEGYFHEGQRVCEFRDGFSPAGAGFAPATRPAFTTTNQLAEIAKTDSAFQAVAEQLMGGPGFSVPQLVRELVESASVPALPAQRYKPSGLLKRHDWEHVWELQRREDAIDAAEKVDEPGLPDLVRTRRQAATARKRAELDDIPVPPKYASSDFKKSVWWSLRGKLDVPKERWITYPGSERTEDPSPVITWAGWDHAQQARAVAEYYVDAKTTFGFSPDQLTLLLAALLELQPWLTQWHSALDPAYGVSPAEAIRAFLESECQALGVTREDLEGVRISTSSTANRPSLSADPPFSVRVRSPGC